MVQKLIGFDIRERKTELRDKYKRIRREMPRDVKKQRDEKIFLRLIGLEAYRSAKTVLTYVSTDIEVDTLQFIERALSDGKTVAVPRCVPGTRDMVFHIIKSLRDLETGSFSVLEPIPQKCKKLTYFDGALCIVPALLYDRYGYRLGYGKGYYDRFLSAHPNMHRVGICYCCCTVTELVHGRYDMAVNTLVTEKYVKNCGKVNGD
ncbi:MAG: 5-formyltetrahydrofolate cyclo-ligase [Prevotella sp.]|nr:5-formyltetrahydrofolate cyclo-ligase [Prevotella sp.]